VKRFLVVVFAAILVAGCGSITKTLQTWVGHNYDELIASWGPPTQFFSNGKGGAIFIYANTTTWVQPGSANTYYSDSTFGSSTYGQATTYYTPAVVQSYTSYRMFWIDSTGTIYSVAWKGLCDIEILCE